MAKQVTTVYLAEELLAVLRQRAAINQRSVSGEVVYLLECALSEKSETTREFLQLMYRAQGAPKLEATGQA